MIFIYLFFLLLVDASITAAISTQQHIKLESVSTTANPHMGTKFHPKIVTDKKKIICEEIQCQIVKNFSLIENLDIDCHLNFLEIEFLAAHGIVVHGYISYSANEIYRNQEKSNACLKIRRYAIDSRYQIVIVINSIQLLSNKDVELFIGWELLKHLEVLTWLSYMFGSYDEINDKIVLQQVIKEIVYSLTILWLSLRVIKANYNWLKITYESYSNNETTIIESRLQTPRRGRR